MTTVAMQDGEDWGPGEGFEELAKKILEKLRSLNTGCTCDKPTYGNLYIGDVRPPPEPRCWGRTPVPKEAEPPNRQLHVIYCTRCNGLTHAYASDEMMEYVPELRKLPLLKKMPGSG